MVGGSSPPGPTTLKPLLYNSPKTLEVSPLPVELLKKLISIPSVYGNEKEIADFCENFL